LDQYLLLGWRSKGPGEFERYRSIEVNEAFAAQYLAVEKILAWIVRAQTSTAVQLRLVIRLGATGTRLSVDAFDDLTRRSGRYGLRQRALGEGRASQ